MFVCKSLYFVKEKERDIFLHLYIYTVIGRITPIKSNNVETAMDGAHQLSALSNVNDLVTFAPHLRVQEPMIAHIRVGSWRSVEENCKGLDEVNHRRLVIGRGWC